MQASTRCLPHANEAGGQALESDRPRFEFGLNHFVTVGKILKEMKIAAEERSAEVGMQPVILWFLGICCGIYINTHFQYLLHRIE